MSARLSVCLCLSARLSVCLCLSARLSVCLSVCLYRPVARISKGGVLFGGKWTLVVFSHQSKTTTRQMLNLCIPMKPFTPGPTRHHRPCRCLVVVLLWCENTISLRGGGSHLGKKCTFVLYPKAMEPLTQDPPPDPRWLRAWIVWMYVCTYVCMYVCMSLSMYVCMYVCIICISMHVYRPV